MHVSLIYRNASCVCSRLWVSPRVAAVFRSQMFSATNSGRLVLPSNAPSKTFCRYPSKFIATAVFSIISTIGSPLGCGEKGLDEESRDAPPARGNSKHMRFCNVEQVFRVQLRTTAVLCVVCVERGRLAEITGRVLLTLFSNRPERKV